MNRFKGSYFLIAIINLSFSGNFNCFVKDGIYYDIKQNRIDLAGYWLHDCLGNQDKLMKIDESWEKLCIEHNHYKLVLKKEEL